MGMHLPLSVRVKTAKTDRHITRDIRDLTFRTTAPGGFASAEFSLDRPLLFTPDEIAYYGTVYIYDGRCGCVVWEGRLEDTGRGSGADGEVWHLTAVGPAAHAHDRTVPLIYVDRRLSDGWMESNFNQIKTADISFGDEVVAAMKMVIPRGTVITRGGASPHEIVDITYQAVRITGQKLARVSCSHISGVTDADWRVKLVTRLDDNTSPGAVVSHQTSTTSQNIAGTVGMTNFVDGHNVTNWRLDRDGSDQTVSNDKTWTKLTGVTVRAMLVDVSGNDITTGYSSDTVLASEVVKDLLGRLLPKYDGANATIETTSYGIEQLANTDGVTPAEVLDQLMEFEPAYYWAAWESNSAGKNRFEWRSWPDTVRYEATVEGGFDSPASADGLYNRVTVVWTDTTGKPQQVTRTQTVPELDDAGLTREHLLDLGEYGGGTANAQRAGDEFLAEHLTPMNAGTLTVTRTILDRDKGRMVEPWEILPGHLIRVRGVSPRVDSLNATGRDGITVFRIVSVEYSTSEAAATLELDSYSRTVAHALAALKKRR